MTISARNQLKATVKSIKQGAVNDAIELLLASGEKLTSVITSESTKNLQLTEGAEVVAIFKASSVILSTDTSLVLSARNQLNGNVIAVARGAVNSEVIVKTAGGNEIVAIITNTSTDALGLTVGSAVNVIIKASHIILGVKRA
ncbi:transporter [Gallibacterium salpingitidis]|uniref:Transporter n=1 Tax=Gallibacterium salpingitidis TaxID=505341 RepID=A0AB36E2D2_9PAST|nr:TOBE domain-containing protein [Gallibacterium salpingitidis]OBX08790.1 transporter [Gallibacterium salpingitidis]OBX10301.1 transporter [Gallibacterium salpingitidis]WKT00884.1 TOBE domain-containing protein [Gallibacterium salpingitidis]